MMLLGLVALPASWALAQKAETTTVTVFAAASLKNALDEVSAGFAQATGNKTTISYAASSALAKQIELAAPADIFISADLDWMDYLAGKGLIDPETRTNLLGNRLVLVAPVNSDVKLDIKEGFPLAAVIGTGRLATGDVKAVPAGKYAKSALEKLKVWSEVEPKLAPTDNVRAALALVAQGEAALGIVYQTDAAAEPKVKIVGTFPEETHAPIIYPIAVTKDSAHPEAARSLLAFLRTPQAVAIFAKQGFAVLK
jgi:molybdate transport system substrate-binding protein